MTRAQGPQLPAVTGLVLTGLLMEPQIDGSDPAVARGVEFILSFRQPDGGVYDRILASYNTSICLSALARVNHPEAAAAIKPLKLGRAATTLVIPRALIFFKSSMVVLVS